MEKYKVSVIVPVYNTEKYLAQCVDTLIRQNYDNLEILLVDDGSTDESRRLCDGFARSDKRIRVIHKENGGLVSAWKRGVCESTGEYLCFVDSDDYIAPDMYELLMRGIREFGVSAAQVARDEIDEKGNPLPDICVPPKEATVLDDREFMEELLMHRGDCSFCTKLIRRDLFPAEAFPVGKLNEDFHLLVRMLPGMGKVASLPDQAYHVFYRIGSNSRKADKETFSRVYADCVENADMVAEIVKRDYPELEDTAFRFGVFQRLEYLLHIPISQMTKDNAVYRGIVAYLRRNWWRAMRNRILTEKNKAYHTLFAIAPRRLRKLHRAWRG